MTQREHISDAIARISRAINAPNDLASQADVIVDVARNSMPEIDHAGVSVAHRDGTVETKAATSELVQELDQLQYSLGEDPCLHAIESDPVVVVQDARSDSRWPRFMEAAVERGLRSQLGLRLYLDEHFGRPRPLPPRRVTPSIPRPSSSPSSRLRLLTQHWPWGGSGPART